jgi:uncharacterized protein YcgI (DUF1989 family)
MMSTRRRTLALSMAARLAVAAMFTVTTASCSSSTSNAAKDAIDNAGAKTSVDVVLNADQFAPTSVAAVEALDVRITIKTDEPQRLQVRKNDKIIVDLGTQQPGNTVTFRAEADTEVTITADPAGAVLMIGPAQP